MFLAVQTYTIRKEMQVNQDQAFAKLHELGIDQVELARTDFTDATLSTLKKHGIEVVSIQVKLRKLEREFEHYVAFLKAAKAKIACVSVMPLPAIIFGKIASIRLAKRLDDLAMRYNSEGITLAYHNHDFEFKKVSGKQKFLWLIEYTERLRFVLDVYWTKRSSEDPIHWIDKLGNRLIGLHLRDCKIDKSDTEVGSGTIDFHGLIKHIPGHLIYGAIEQNSFTPYESIKQSIAYLDKIITAEE